MSYTVLIVDDSKLARMSAIKALLALHPDWSRIEASSSDEALRRLAESSPDIALVDFNMPGRDGLELASDLISSRPTMQIAVISANIQQEIVNRTRAMGAFFIAKPMTQEKLAEFLSIAAKHLQGAGS